MSVLKSSVRIKILFISLLFLCIAVPLLVAQDNNSLINPDLVDVVIEPTPPIEEEKVELPSTSNDMDIIPENPIDEVEANAVPPPSSGFDTFESTEKSEVGFGTFTEKSDQPNSNNTTSAQIADGSLLIISSGILTREEIAAYIRFKLPSIDVIYPPEAIITTYISEANTEGVNSDIAIAQMLFATNFLQNSSFLKLNNPVGIGASNKSTWRLAKFLTLSQGVRAHIQHLKAYASDAPFRNPIVDPRYSILLTNGLIGTSKSFKGLIQSWYYNPSNTDVNPIYDEINNILKEMIAFSSS